MAEPEIGGWNRLLLEGTILMARIWKLIFAISGVLLLLGSFSSPALLPYPLFTLAYFRRWHLPRKGSPAVQLLFSTFICTLILEFSAWLNEYVKKVPQPALFHPQLIPDLLISTGLYAAWWLTWWLALRRYRFTTAQVFITTGLYGVVIEQQGTIFWTGLQTLPAGAALWLFVFVVYGSTMALAFWLVRDSFTATRDHWLKYVLSWMELFALSYLTSIVWGVVLQAVNIIPPRKLPIQDYPLW